MPAADVAQQQNSNPLNTDLARWDEDGYCVFPSLFSPSQVSSTAAKWPWRRRAGR
jgi:hypothetical protein|eukprot:COSAG01_NODE_2475_length_7623_cov_8.394072_1_plen_55_part_00